VKIGSFCRALSPDREPRTESPLTPHRLADSTAELCRLAFHPNPHEGTGDPADCHVEVSKPARQPLLSGQGVCPVDALIVNSKLVSETSETAVLFTVRRKRAPE